MSIRPLVGLCGLFGVCCRSIERPQLAESTENLLLNIGV